MVRGRQSKGVLNRRPLNVCGTSRQSASVGWSPQQKRISLHFHDPLDPTPRPREGSRCGAGRLHQRRWACPVLFKAVVLAICPKTMAWPQPDFWTNGLLEQQLRQACPCEAQARPTRALLCAPRRWQCGLEPAWVYATVSADMTAIAMQTIALCALSNRAIWQFLLKPPQAAWL